MEKENYNQIIFTAVKDNFLSGYFYIPKVAYEGMQGYILNENELNELLNDTILKESIIFRSERKNSLYKR